MTIFNLLLTSSLAGSICSDGTYSQSEGRGTCSYHGGISPNGLSSYNSNPRIYIRDIESPSPQPIIKNGWKDSDSLFLELHTVTLDLRADKILWCNEHIVATAVFEPISSELILGKMYSSEPYIKSTSYLNSDLDTVYNKLLYNGDILVLIDYKIGGAALIRYDRGSFIFDSGPICI